MKMSRESFDELKENIENLLSNFEEIKREIRMNAPKLFERWKAGGCAVDGDFISMYPALQSVLEDLENEIEVEEEEDEESEEEETER